MDIEGLDNRSVMKALEVSGTHMTKIDYSTHGFLYLEITKRRIDNEGMRWFLCCSTPKQPDNYSRGDSKLFGKVLHAAWDRYFNKKGELEKETTMLEEVVMEQEQNIEQPTPQQRSSPEQTTTTTPSTRAVSPSASSPQLKEDDQDLLVFFRTIISADYLSKDDLFLTTGLGLRTKLVAFAKQMEANKHEERFNLFYDAPEEYTNKDISEMEPCPCLNGKYNIPMSVPAITEVATAMFNLAESVPEVLQLPKFSGSKGRGKTLVPVVPTSDPRRLYHNAKQWLQCILSESITTVGTYDAVKVLTRVLHSIDPIAVEDASAVLLDSADIRSRYKLDPELQQAMMFKANLGVTQMRVVKQFLCYSNLDILQPETVMRELQVEEFVRPIAIEFREGKGNRKRCAWHVPVDDLLVHNTNQKLKDTSIDYKNLNKAHIVLVGDHGQGAFRMMATLLLITKPKRRRGNWRHRGQSTEHEYTGTKLSLEVDGLCGYVQCLKDTYQILDDTIAKPMNESLKKIRDKGRVTIFQKPTGNVEICFGPIHTTQGVELASAPVELFMVGDLAFYSMVLGKESMANHWCWRCRLSKSEWTNDTNTRTGAEWTLENMEQHLNKLESGELNKKESDQVRGIKSKALYCIPPKNFLVPSLHNVELFVNTPICKGFMKWVYHRIEQLPLELIDARLENIDLIIELEQTGTELKEAKETVEFLKAEAKSLKPIKRRITKELVFRDDDHKCDYTDNQKLLEEAKDRFLELQGVYVGLGKDKQAKEQKIKTIVKKKENGALSQEIRQSVEEMLEEVYRIIRSAYHGGDFEGNHCRKWMRQADSVMDSIETILLSVPRENRARGCDDAEIHRCCRSYKRLFQYFDALMHYCQQPFGTLTDDNVVEVRRLVETIDRLWRKLMPTVPPKAHAWWHLLDDLERLRGLKHHSESKIEVAHQVGRRIDLLFRSVNDMTKKIECGMRFQYTSEKASLQSIQADVKESRSRKRKADVLEDQEDDRHRQMLLLLELPEIVDEFKSLEQMSVDDRKEELALVNDVNNNNNNNGKADAT